MNTSIITVVKKKKKLQAVHEKHTLVASKQEKHEQQEGQAEQRDHQGQVEGDRHPDHNLNHVAQQVLQARQPTAVPEQEAGLDRPGHYNGQGAAGEVVANDDYAEDYPGHVYHVCSVERQSGSIGGYWEEFQPYQKRRRKVSRKFVATHEKLTLVVYGLCWGIEQRGVSGLAKLPDFQKRCRKSMQNGGS